MVAKLALRQVFLQVSCYSFLVVTPALLHTHQSPPPEVYDSSDQAAHYHIRSLEMWDFISILCIWLVIARKSAGGGGANQLSDFLHFCGKNIKIEKKRNTSNINIEN
jgi:hypothetical protein